MTEKDDDSAPDPTKIPALFATIHWRGPARPDGYTSEEVWTMNYDANAHLPELQQTMQADWDRTLAAMSEGEFGSRLAENEHLPDVVRRMLEARDRGVASGGADGAG